MSEAGPSTYIENRAITTLPIEVWDTIFKLFMHNRWGGQNKYPKLLPESGLHPLLFVCKAWQSIAERRLYSSVGLGSNRTIKDDVGTYKTRSGKDVFQQFCQTIMGNFRLASLVQGLYIDSRFFNLKQGEDLVRLLSICNNVKRCSIKVFPLKKMDHAKLTLAQTDLVLLEYVVHRRDYALEGLVTIAQFLRFIHHWPRLESLTVDLRGISLKKIPPQPPLSEVVSQCPNLRKVIFSSQDIKPLDLHYLLKIAPKLEHLSIEARYECEETLRQCLPAWSTTLKVLNITLYGRCICWRKSRIKSWRSAAEDPIITSSFPELHELSASLAVLPAIALVNFPRLETLSYEGGHADGLDLARLIEEGKLPYLRSIKGDFCAELKITHQSTRCDPTSVTEVNNLLRKVCGEPRNIVCNLREAE